MNAVRNLEHINIRKAEKSTKSNASKAVQQYVVLHAVLVSPYKHRSIP